MTDKKEKKPPKGLPKHPLTIQEEKLTKMEIAFDKIIAKEGHTDLAYKEALKIDKLRHKVLVDTVKATIQIMYASHDKLEAIIDTKQKLNET